MKPSPRRAIPKGCDRPELINGWVLAVMLDGVRRTLPLVLSTTKKSPVFFCARPWELPGTVTSCVGGSMDERSVTSVKTQIPDPESVLETTRSPLAVILPHCGCRKAAEEPS